LLLTVVDFVPPTAIEVTLPWAAVNSEACPSKQHLALMLKVFESLSKCIHTLAYLHQRYAAAAAPAFSSNGSLKPDVLAATAVLQDAALQAKMHLGEPLAAAEATSFWSVSQDDVRAWFAGLDKMIQKWGRHLLAVTAELLTTATAEVQNVTPVYSHFLNEKQINVRMVKTHLLGPVRKALSDKVVALHRAMGLYTTTARDWRQAPAKGETSTAVPAPEDPELDCAKLAFDAGKAALTVVAACAVVYDGGANRRQEAITLASVPRPEIPKPLWAEVLKASKGGPAKPEAVSAGDGAN
jgi:hypothetical protein